MRLIIKDRYNIVVSDYNRKVIVSKNVCFGGLAQSYPIASLPLLDDDKLLIKQGDEWKQVDNVDINAQSDMAMSFVSEKSYVKNKNRILFLSGNSNMAITWDDAEVFNENQTLVITLTNVPIGHTCILTSGIGASTTIDAVTFDIINLRDNLQIKEKQSAVIFRLSNGKFLIR